MCIICLEFQKLGDIMDARRMLEAAGREPTAIPKEHLEEVAEMLDKVEKETQSS